MLEFLGRGLVLLTGLPGSAKSYVAVEAMMWIRKNHPEVKVYSHDIPGLEVEGVLPAPLDWRDTDENSVVFYDEAADIEWCKASTKLQSDDDRVNEFRRIRKGNRNVVLMTQDPAYIHIMIRKLVQTHYHMSNPQMDPVKTKFYEFRGSAIPSFDNPRSWKSRVFNEGTIDIVPEVYNNYISISKTAKHDKKKKMPKKVKRLLIGLCIAIPLIIILMIVGLSVMFGAQDELKEKSKLPNEIESENTTTTSNINNSIKPTIKPIPNAHLYQRTPKPDKEQLRMKYMPQHIYYTAYDENIRPATIIIKNLDNGKRECRAYNAYSEPLLIEDDLCFLMGEKPAFIPRSRVKRDEKQDNPLDSNKEKKQEYKAPFPDLVS